MGRDAGYSTIDAYVALFEPQVQTLLQTLRETIHAAAPLATEKISWSMPTFYQNGNLVHFAAFKKHIGFFPGADGIEAFKEKLSAFKWSKGGIQFPLDKPLPLSLVSEIVRYRVEMNSK